MRVSSSIDSIYQNNVTLAQDLKSFVDTHIISNKYEKWHYISRIKSLESFALKLERGGISSSSTSLDDFFACTIVVENSTQIDKAKDLVNKFCDIKCKRPNSNDFTHKQSSSFEFDDLRLYVTIKHDVTVPNEQIKEIVFEIQIKTFLFHAWTIAVHDLTYKSDEINWGKQRVAYQIRAVLEQAECAIADILNLSKLPQLDKNNKETKALNKILKVFKNHFNKIDLPSDLVRLCSNTSLLLNQFDVKENQLDAFLKAETSAGRGTNMLGLSPYQIVLLGVFYQCEDKLLSVLKGDIMLSIKIVITRELLDFIQPDIREFILNSSIPGIIVLA